MRIASFAIGLLVSVVPAFAFSPEEPVNVLVTATVENWAGTNEEFKFVLAEELLATVYSQGFAKAYRDAKKKISGDAGDGEDYEPFGYDIITNSQDGCPLQDVKSEVASSGGGKAEVIVSFKHFACMGDQAEYQFRNVVHFDVVEEGGKAVVDNIRHQGDEGEQSLRDDLADIIKGQ
jgi:hypothetical protein